FLKKKNDKRKDLVTGVQTGALPKKKNPPKKKKKPPPPKKKKKKKKKKYSKSRPLPQKIKYVKTPPPPPSHDSLLQE
ncbi:MAG: hypothetical protein GY782_05775, partial [Gammaproteobacteria bacterium]|nr:hypothetical protein [Gammaproteobacteria bacterium]